jgi:hypothetical protein
MKQLTFFFFILLSCLYFSQNKIVKDTVFYKKNSFDKIYLEKNKKSKYYKYLIQFTDFKINSPEKLVKSLGLGTRFVKVYQYKKNYLLYAPCDWCTHTQVQILDENIQFRNCESIGYKILSLKKISKNIFKIIYLDFDKVENTLIIENVNIKKGIYKFTNKRKQEVETYFMVDINGIKKLDIIVNECEEKSKEFEFDK